MLITLAFFSTYHGKRTKLQRCLNMKKYPPLCIFIASVLSVYPYTAVEAQADHRLTEEKQLVLEEVIVTARKREENLQHVPISVQAIQGESILEDNTLKLETLSSSVPNLHVAEIGKT